MFRICKQFSFEAAHHLVGWPPDHQCSRIHGHSYKVEVYVAGEVSNGTDRPGAVVDYARISEVFKSQVFSVLDHHDLNAVTGLSNTTAENLSVWIFQRLKSFLNVEKVRVWETATAWAEWPA